MTLLRKNEKLKENEYLPMKNIIHVKDTEEDVKRVCGNESRRQCRGAVNMISAAELISHFLSLSAAPGGSISRLNTAEDLLLL